MSVTIVLIPLAFAVAGAVSAIGAHQVNALHAEATGHDGGGSPQKSSDQQPLPVSVKTRMKDRTLLHAALEEIGATRITADEQAVTANLDGTALTMIRSVDQVWQAHFEQPAGVAFTVDDARGVLTRLDGAYAHLVQQAVAQRIRERADAAGFELVSETSESDETLTMVLNVKDHS